MHYMGYERLEMLSLATFCTRRLRDSVPKPYDVEKRLQKSKGSTLIPMSHGDLEGIEESLIVRSRLRALRASIRGGAPMTYPPPRAGTFNGVLQGLVHNHMSLL